MTKDRPTYIKDILKIEPETNLQFLQRQTREDLKKLFISKARSKLPF